MTRSIIRFCAPLVGLTAVLVAMARPSWAAITNLTPITGGPNAGVLGDIAYDDKHQVYLHVYESSNTVAGQFVGTDGVPKGAAFTIGAGLTFALKPQVAYSSGTADDVFFVPYVSDASGNALFGQLVRYTGAGATGGQLVGGRFSVSPTGTSATDVVYNPNLRQFLVVWDYFHGSPANYDVYGRLFDTAGAPVSAELPIETGANNQGASKVAYDWEHHRYLVVYQGDHPVNPYNGAFARLLDDSGAVISGLIEASAGVYLELNVTYLPERDGFLMYWTAFTGVRDVIGRIVPSNWAGSFDGDVFPLLATSQYAEGGAEGDYNPATRTVLMAAMSSVLLLRGMELSGTGSPMGSSYNLSGIPTSPTGGTFYPRLVRGASAQWGVHYIVDYNSVWLERFAGTLAETPGPSFGDPITPPPPPPAPVPPLPDPSGGDFSAGGSVNLLWQHTDGSLSAWQLSGRDFVSGAALNPPRVNDAKWHVVGTGDFNMDGKRDILFQYDDGWVAVWLMNGTSMTVAKLLTPARVGDADWRIVGAGDINADGSTDIIFRHRTQGWVAAWIMNGTVMQSASLLNPSRVPDLGWKIVAIGDLNGDTHPDIVWQHDSGVITSWLMNGLTMVAPGIFSPNHLNDPAWQIRAIGDVNSDGKPDLIWQHTTKNWLATTILDGTTVIDSVFLSPSAVNPGWSIVGPK